MAFAQSTVLGQNCDLAMLGATETGSFLAFDREFRYALSNQDAGVMALLVKPSLRVNDERGGYDVDDARSLQLRFGQIFTQPIRDAVLKEKPEMISCVSGGLMYGDGIVWVELTGKRYAVKTVNIPQSDRRPESPARVVEFVCNADKHRIIVDALGDGAPRYRAWTKPHSLMDKPDLEISGGKREFEGTGVCAYARWTFTSGGATYSLDGPGGCFESTKQPPAESRGSLEVSLPGKADVNWWCR